MKSLLTEARNERSCVNRSEGILPLIQSNCQVVSFLFEYKKNQALLRPDFLNTLKLIDHGLYLRRRRAPHGIALESLDPDNLPPNSKRIRS